MSEKRDYLPGVVVHSPQCVDIASRNLPRMPTPTAARVYPNGQQHKACYHVKRDPIAVIETVEYGDHVYEPSSVRPLDATRALCVVCNGTHPEPSVLDRLILPPGVR